MSLAWSIWGSARSLCTSGCWDVLEQVSSGQTPKAALPSLDISCASQCPTRSPRGPHSVGEGRLGGSQPHALVCLKPLSEPLEDGRCVPTSLWVPSTWQRGPWGSAFWR